MTTSQQPVSVFKAGPRPIAPCTIDSCTTDQTVAKLPRPPLKTRVLLTSANQTDFGRKPLVAHHNLHHSELFTDDALINLLDNFPRQNLYAITMGNDPCRNENQLAITDGVNGVQLLQAVRNGRLWLNITRVDRADQRYRKLINELYEQLTSQLPGFTPDLSQGTLLISSPNAMVYYHADGPSSVLWHIRGHKRVWVYPALDERYMRREHLEAICAGVSHEYLPFQHSYDQAALAYDLEPGEWAAWPQNAPHRVTNLDSLNVSLSTEHFTRQSRRRVQVYAANHFLRTRLGLRQLSQRETGVGAATKTAIQHLARKLGLHATHHKRYTPTLRVDANAPNGVATLADMIKSKTHL